MRTRRVAALLALPLAAAFALSGCSVVNNAVNGAVNAGQEQIKKTVTDAIGQAMGGVTISTDGKLPDGVPSVPFTGKVDGGATVPNGKGWAVRTTFASGDSYQKAADALTGAGYTAQVSQGDATSGFGTFQGATDNVLLAVVTTNGSTTATYVVSPAAG